MSIETGRSNVVAGSAARPSEEVAWAIRTACQRLFANEADFLRRFSTSLLALVPRLRDLPDDQGRVLAEGLGRAVLWAALTEDPVDVVEATFQNIGADHSQQGFPVEGYHGVGHALLRAARDTYTSDWTSELSSGWVAYYGWLGPFLQRGAAQSAQSPPGQPAPADVTSPPFGLAAPRTAPEPVSALPSSGAGPRSATGDTPTGVPQIGRLVGGGPVSAPIHLPPPLERPAGLERPARLDRPAALDRPTRAPAAASPEPESPAHHRHWGAPDGWEPPRWESDPGPRRDESRSAHLGGPRQPDRPSDRRPDRNPERQQAGRGATTWEVGPTTAGLTLATAAGPVSVPARVAAGPVPALAPTPAAGFAPPFTGRDGPPSGSFALPRTGSPTPVGPPGAASLTQAIADGGPRTLDEVLDLVHSRFFLGNERALGAVLTRVALRTGADLRAPRPDQRANPAVIANVMAVLQVMGYAVQPAPDALQVVLSTESPPSRQGHWWSRSAPAGGRGRRGSSGRSRE